MATQTPELDRARRHRARGALGLALGIGLTPVWRQASAAATMTMWLAAITWWLVCRRLARNAAEKAADDPARRLTLWWAGVSEGLVRRHRAVRANAVSPPATVTAYRAAVRPKHRRTVAAASFVALVWASAWVGDVGPMRSLWSFLVLWAGIQVSRHLYRLAIPEPPPPGVCLHATASHVALASRVPGGRETVSGAPPPWVAPPLTLAWRDVTSIQVTPRGAGGTGQLDTLRVFYRDAAAPGRVHQAALDILRVDLDLGAFVGLARRHAPHAPVTIDARSVS